MKFAIIIAMALVSWAITFFTNHPPLTQLLITLVGAGAGMYIVALDQPSRTGSTHDASDENDC